MALKNAVYVLPRLEDCLEDFQWIREEAIAGGGEAHVCEADFLGSVRGAGRGKAGRRRNAPKPRPLSANLEVAHAFRRGQKSRWIYGLALGHDFSQSVEAIGEVFGEASARFSDVELDWNLGGRWRLTPRFVLLVSSGAGIIRSSREPRTRFQSYAGFRSPFGRCSLSRKAKSLNKIRLSPEAAPAFMLGSLADL